MRVLLTGASGLLGGEMAGVLVDRGHMVTALLHHSPAVHRNDGSAVPTRPWAAGPHPGAVAVLRGSVAKPWLGLDPAAHATLRAEQDLVIHLAAVTGFDADPALLAAVNVAGTAHVLAFAAGDRPVPVLHVSTAYVCGAVSGPVAEDDPTGAGPFANGYEASKAQGEALVQQARRGGLPVAIARPSIVVGAYADGAIGRMDGVYALIRLVAEGRVRALPATPGASLDLVPIDHVVAGLLHMAERMDLAAGRTVHLVSGAPVSVAALVGLAAEYPHFAVARLVDPAQFDLDGLPASAQALHRRVTAHYASYLQRAPRFRDDALRDLGGRPCPPTGVGFLRRLVDRCIATGYLPAGPAALAAQRTGG